MRHFRKNHSRMLVAGALTVIFIFLGACASAPRLSDDRPQTNQIPAAEEPEFFWWRVKFKLQWPEQQQPDFSYHVFIADRILRPVIALRNNDIPLWRFHRRAARDGAGHQFSFIFFADTPTATGVKRDIESSKLLSMLRQESVIEALCFTDGEIEKQSLLSATSDSSWPLEIQQSWPYFIMGASKSWLEQIKLIGAQIQKQSDNPGELELEEMLSYYQGLNKRLSAQWTQYGRHAYLHHLNALYGYVPVYIHEIEDLWKF